MGDVVVECDDWPRKIERGVNCVGDVITEVVVFDICRCCDTISLGEIGGVELLLLMAISNEPAMTV